MGKWVSTEMPRGGVCGEGDIQGQRAALGSLLPC